MPAEKQSGVDLEFQAIPRVYDALKDLDPESATRVLDYVRRKLGLSQIEDAPPVSVEPQAHPHPPSIAAATQSDTTDGVSPVANKWLRRSGLSLPLLEGVFSIGATDEIDLVAKKLPSKAKYARVREVMLLKAIAGYLSTGVPKVSHDAVKQTCEHYDAYDVTNFSKAIKALAPEISGSKQAGYTLTARGLAASADLIKQMVATKA